MHVPVELGTPACSGGDSSGVSCVCLIADSDFLALVDLAVFHKMHWPCDRGHVSSKHIHISTCTFIRHLHVFGIVSFRNLSRKIRVSSAHVFVGRCKTHCKYDFRIVPRFRRFWSDGALTLCSICTPTQKKPFYATHKSSVKARHLSSRRCWRASLMAKESMSSSWSTIMWCARDAMSGRSKLLQRQIT